MTAADLQHRFSDEDLRDFMGEVARLLLGHPNRAMSSGKNMRYGARGSLSVDLNKGTWYDFETEEGGGVLDLIERVTGLRGEDRFKWLRENGFDGSGKSNNSKPDERSNKRAHGDRHPKLGKPATTYPYFDAIGTLLFEVARFDPKDFRPRQPDGNGSWFWDLQGLDDKRVVYRLSEIIEAISLGRKIYICEGEKDTHAAVEIGLDATCNQGGTGGGWRAQYNETFRDADVVIVPHNDDAGRKHAENIAASLSGVASKIRILKLWESWKECPLKADFYDWQQVPGHTREQFDALVDAAPMPEPKLPFIDMSNWDNEIPPRQEWAVSDRIPIGHVSLFSGEGGAGKSLIMLQWAACHVIGRDWFDAPLKQGPALLIDAEDDEKVIHKRLADILDHHGVMFADVRRDLHIASLAGKDAVLATFGHKSGKIEPTPLYDTLLEMAGDIKPVVTGIAASADVFAGDEIDRSQVRQFIAMLTRIAMTAGGAVVLISHPSVAGINSGSGLSGSTAWHNSVRSRFYLKGVKPEKGDDDDEAPDNDLREIEFRKNNYGPISESITLRYQNGLFLPVTASTADQAVREVEAERVFLAVLIKMTNQGQDLNPNKYAHTYAPAMITSHPDAKGFKKSEMEAAMQRLLEQDKVHVNETGPASKRRKYLRTGRRPLL